MSNLSIYGYGVKSFTLSMLETAMELTERRIPAADLDVILGWGKRMLMEPTELPDGVEETVRALSGRHDLLLITKGDLFDQESKLARSGLGDLFESVEIVAEKDDGAYRRILEGRGIAPDGFVMIGNAARSDVQPTLAIGAYAIHVPYPLTWAHEQIDETALT